MTKRRMMRQMDMRVAGLQSGALVKLGLVGLLMLSACGGGGGRDWDLRTNGGSTADAARSVADSRPTPDANGVISYPGYQVVVARQGDTVQSVASRLGVDGAQLASYNALQTGDSLRGGEVLALPTRVTSAAPTGIASAPITGGIIGVTPPSGGVDVASIATTALDKVDGGAAQGTAPAANGVPFAAAQPGPQPMRHQVARGETAFTIARLYNVSAKDLADWNGLGSDFSVREGQYLLIPTTSAGAAPAAGSETVPGQGSPTPEPPSASEPLPNEATQPASEAAKATPTSPNMGNQRTGASASQFVMPASGSIIRAYQKGKNEGIDIAATAGDPVKAAADGTVAAVTKDTTGTPILVLRHADGLLTVYAGVDGIKVAKGDAVKRGQTIGVVRAGNPAFLHFEVRKGIESVDPMPYLQ